MAPSTWTRLSTTAVSTRQTTAELRDTIERRTISALERIPANRSARFDLWRIAMAVSIVLVPALILAIFDLSDLTIPSLVLLVTVGFATYLSDRIGGWVSLVVSLFMLQFVIVDRFRISLTGLNGGDIARLLTYLIVGVLLVMVIEHLKNERSAARLEAAAMRAANTALSAVEIAAAGRPAGDNLAYIRVLESLLAAMVRVNRASAGALYLLDGGDSTLVRAASYGDLEDPNIGLDDMQPSSELQVGEGFAGRVVRERRPTTITDVDDEIDVDVFDIRATNPHVRSVAGVPLIDQNDQVIGVAWVGLYVPYRFSPTAFARLQSLSLRTVAFMESARLADLQEEMLDRVQDNHRRLQSVIQTMPEAMMVARPPSGTIVASNAAAQRMFGIRLDRQLRTTQVDHLRVAFTDNGSDQEMPIMRAMLDGEVVTGVELTVTLPDGSAVPVVASAAPLFTEDGEIDAVVGVFQDVRPLKEAERLRDEFISVVSHELRSPLTPIRGFAQVVARDLAKEGGHDRHVAWLNTLQIQVDRMTRLVDDLLDVSRLRAGRLRIRRTDVDLVTICRTVVDSRQATASDHELIFLSPCEKILAKLDGDRIHQVIDNLVGNALKYTLSGKITLSVEPAAGDRSIVIEISDEGTGIPPADRDHLFTPFYRARSAAESAVPGLGLGLYICRELIEAHDGTITADEAPNGGARFTIVLPWVRPSTTLPA